MLFYRLLKKLTPLDLALQGVNLKVEPLRFEKDAFQNSL